MARRRICPDTLNLLDWEPPLNIERFEDDQVKGTDLAGKVSRVVATALNGCDLAREVIAQRMSDYLDECVTINMLNAYASEARCDHNISVTRFAALIEATGDLRLLSILPELFGLVAVEARYVAAIEEAMINDQMEALAVQKRERRKRWKGRP